MANFGNIPLDFIKEWVAPYYMHVLNSNYCRGTCDEEFVGRAKHALAVISPVIIDTLLADRGWRSRLVAAWFCGLKGWTQYEDAIGESLLESRTCYAGQGYCFALAKFASKKSSSYLGQYLEIFLPQINKYYDQGWAMPALMWVDEKRHENLSAAFLKPGGLWDTFVADKINAGGLRDSFAADGIDLPSTWTLRGCKDRFYQAMKTSVEVFGRS